MQITSPELAEFTAVCAAVVLETTWLQVADALEEKTIYVPKIPKIKAITIKGRFGIRLWLKFSGLIQLDMKFFISVPYFDIRISGWVEIIMIGKRTFLSESIFKGLPIV
jgi:hypothetical protein